MEVKYVATVLTVYGIETHILIFVSYMDVQKLQQCLPFTVLKPLRNEIQALA